MREIVVEDVVKNGKFCISVGRRRALTRQMVGGFLRRCQTRLDVSPASTHISTCSVESTHNVPLTLELIKLHSKTLKRIKMDSQVIRYKIFLPRKLASTETMWRETVIITFTDASF